MFYTVIEVQNDGTPSVLTTVYSDQNDADAAFFTICAAAAKSAIAYHAAFILRSDGIVSRGEVYDRRVVVEVE